MNIFKTCDWCGRSIATSTWDRPSAHAPGCHIRLGLLAQAAARRKRRREDQRTARRAARALEVSR